MTQSVADRIAEIRRTKKRPARVIANWIARERRRGHAWLADSIAAQAGTGHGMKTDEAPFRPASPRNTLRGTVKTAGPMNIIEPPRQRSFWWQDE